jgi:hypothetical protein
MMRSTVSTNPGDGRDHAGRALDITIRIGPDGVIYFHDLTIDLLPVAAALAPGDPDLARRGAATSGALQEPDA